mmetsp:Transcript_61754/g.111101  ORF Transcript_61754/g.111101 Transcript_61754/m.111101 type:complete len:280 (+) Transcript_61754:268-1107(+)
MEGQRYQASGLSTMFTGLFLSFFDKLLDRVFGVNTFQLRRVLLPDPVCERFHVGRVLAVVAGVRRGVPVWALVSACVAATPAVAAKGSDAGARFRALFVIISLIELLYQRVLEGILLPLELLRSVFDHLQLLPELKVMDVLVKVQVLCKVNQVISFHIFEVLPLVCGHRPCRFLRSAASLLGLRLQNCYQLRRVRVGSLFDEPNGIALLFEDLSHSLLPVVLGPIVLIGLHLILLHLGLQLLDPPTVATKGRGWTARLELITRHLRHLALQPQSIADSV